MAGNKNSGRKSWDKEIQSRELWDLAIPVLKHALLSTSEDLKMRKIDIALALVNKMIPMEVKNDNSGDKHYHYTTIQLTDKSESELISTLLGRTNGVDTQRQLNPTSSN